MPRLLRHFITAALLASWGQWAFTDTRATPQSASRGVTSVTGESWLNHLHRSFNETSMGKTYQLGPGVLRPGEEVGEWRLQILNDATIRTMNLRGSDLYRLNCQGCHRESGRGAPPEIGSIVDPVRATSARLVMIRMKSAGVDLSHKAAAELAKQAEQALIQRLHSGGQDMPAFGHLNAAEVHLLVAYLNELADVTGKNGSEPIVGESPVRVGELIVKSTCHVCHDATGPNPSPEQLQYGVIPPLGTLTLRTSLAQFVRKVTVGAPLLAGEPPMLRAGRMPVFHYLGQNEAAAIYLYLTLYPPSETGIGNLDDTLPQPREGAAGSLQPSSMADNPPSRQDTAGSFAASQTGDWVTLIALGAIGFAVCLVAGALLLTLAVFTGLSSGSQRVTKVIREVRADRKESITVPA